VVTALGLQDGGARRRRRVMSSASRPIRILTVDDYPRPKRLGPRYTATDCGAGALGLVAPTHRAGDRAPARDDQRLPEGRRHRRAGARVVAPRARRNRPLHWRGCPPTRIPRARPIGLSGAWPHRGRKRPFRARCPPTPAHYASVRRFVVALRGTTAPRRASSSRPRPAKKARWTTARARWCGTPPPASTGARASSF
jgi:hypothetical protein